MLKIETTFTVDPFTDKYEDNFFLKYVQLTVFLSRTKGTKNTMTKFTKGYFMPHSQLQNVKKNVIQCAFLQAFDN